MVWTIFKSDWHKDSGFKRLTDVCNSNWKTKEGFTKTMITQITINWFQTIVGSKWLSFVKNQTI